MAKYYLYLVLSLFIFINGVGYFEKEIKLELKKELLLKYKLQKQHLYASHISEVEFLLQSQEKIFLGSKELFFEKNKKETLIFSEIQKYIQGIAEEVDAKVKQLNTGIVVDKKFYRKYPINLNLTLIPEDLDFFFKNLYKSKKYLFVDSIQISTNKREGILHLKITLIGYQIK
jgi:Tfp pilus assembly protein PilO